MLPAFKNALRWPLARLGYEIHKAQPDPNELFFRRGAFRTVLDVGAFVGAFAQEARRLSSEAVIHSFEPLHPSYEQLQNALPNDARFFPHQTAVGETDGSTDILMDEFPASTSILPMTALHREAFVQTGRQTKVTVPITTLDTWAETAKLEPPILMKLDVQGYEDRVLRGATKLLPKIAAVILEVCFVELYHGQPLFCDLNSRMQDAGFALQGIVEESRNPKTGVAMYADAFYLRH